MANSCGTTAFAFDQYSSGRVIPFSNPQPSREVSLVVHESFARDGLLNALAASIHASLPPELCKRDPQLKTIKFR